jgi:2-amino-4-hydroxy-6-hydroxymethyldihydropteridine diphosphokinase
MAKLDHLYLIALGSNQRHAQFGAPSNIISQAFEALEMEDVDVFATASIMSSAPVGPSKRIYANSAAILASPLPPPEMLVRLKALERHFGRRISGQNWRSRVLDLDIILWSGGIWTSNIPALAIPHTHMRDRSFVLGPAREIAADWRDPISGFSINHLFHRLNSAKPLDRRNLRH